jgi:hypothetical protein
MLQPRQRHHNHTMDLVLQQDTRHNNHLRPTDRRTWQSTQHMQHNQHNNNQSLHSRGQQTMTPGWKSTTIHNNDNNNDNRHNHHYNNRNGTRRHRLQRVLLGTTRERYQ